MVCRILTPMRISERLKRAYVAFDSRTGSVEIVRGQPVKLGKAEAIEVTTLFYLGTVGLISSLLRIFPDHRDTISGYLRDVAEAIDQQTW